MPDFSIRQSFDKDADESVGDFFDAEDEDEREESGGATALRTEADFRQGRAAEIYALYTERYKRWFRWLSPHHFVADLGSALKADATTFLDLLVQFGEWQAAKDAKLSALEELLNGEHADRKVLVFTQFADTVLYLESELKTRGMSKMAAVTGDTPDVTKLAWCFSPRSNEKEDPHNARR